MHEALSQRDTHQWKILRSRSGNKKGCAESPGDSLLWSPLTFCQRHKVPQKIHLADWIPSGLFCWAIFSTFNIAEEEKVIQFTLDYDLWSIAIEWIIRSYQTCIERSMRKNCSVSTSAIKLQDPWFSVTENKAGLRCIQCSSGGTSNLLYGFLGSVPRKSWAQNQGNCMAPIRATQSGDEALDAA